MWRIQLNMGNAVVAAALAFATSICDAMVTAAGNNSPWTMLMIAILIGSAVHFVISLLVTLKNVGVHLYLMIQLAGVWYLIPHGLRMDLIQEVKAQAAFFWASASLASDAVVRMATNATTTRTIQW
jgi:hypothetical protein